MPSYKYSLATSCWFIYTYIYLQFMFKSTYYDYSYSYASVNAWGIELITNA